MRKKKEFWDRQENILIIKKEIFKPLKRNPSLNQNKNSGMNTLMISKVIISKAFFI